MKLQLQFKDYLKAMKAVSNEPLCLSTMFKPFDVNLPSSQSEDLLIGHVLDYMTDSKKRNEYIDIIDIANAAIDLGSSQAQYFLDNAPMLLLKSNPAYRHSVTPGVI